MATKKATNNVSYRKSTRDYSQTFAWTDELRENVYKFYCEARSDPSPGYMKRHKSLWDAKYPQFTHLTANHLRQQATQVEKKKNTVQTEQQQPVMMTAAVEVTPTDEDDGLRSSDNDQNLPEETSTETQNDILQEEENTGKISFEKTSRNLSAWT